MSFPPVNRATTVEPGNLELAGYLEASKDSTICCSTPRVFDKPGVGLGWRYGLTDGIDLGGRASTIGGAELSAKFTLLRQGRLRLTLMPSFATWFPMNAGSTGALTLLAGYSVGDRLELVLAPRAAVATAQQTEFGTSRIGTPFDTYFGAGGSAASFVLVGSRTRIALGFSAHHLERLTRPPSSRNFTASPHLQAGLAVLVTLGSIEER